jgi:membrane associated rhomboid family serine protease
VAAYLRSLSPRDRRPTGFPVENTREPIFNVPPVVLGLVAFLCIVHVMVAFVLPEDASETLFELFAFEPLRYYASNALEESLRGGVPADIWTFVTYAFLHVNLTHLVFNLTWLVAFGPPVARRFGTWRFLAFFAFTAATGALAHLVSHLGEDVPAIRASAAVLGMLAAAMRFVFQPGGPLGSLRLSETTTYQVPAKPLGAMLRDPRMLRLVLVLLGLNVLSELPLFSMPGIEGSVAWQAHLGGFIGGLLAFAAFDPVPTLPATQNGPDADARSIDDEAASS